MTHKTLSNLKKSGGKKENEMSDLKKMEDVRSQKKNKE